MTGGTLTSRVGKSHGCCALAASGRFRIWRNCDKIFNLLMSRIQDYTWLMRIRPPLIQSREQSNALEKGEASNYFLWLTYTHRIWLLFISNGIVEMKAEC